MTKKVMKIESENLMVCKICGARHWAMESPETGKFYRGAWQCQNGCKYEQVVE